jgi:hypothetical protein
VGTAVTDAGGAFAFPKLSTGRVELTFELDGFTTSVLPVVVPVGSEAQLVERLDLANFAETVLVRSAPPYVPPPPRVLKPVPAHDREVLCGPAKAPAVPASLGTIRARTHDAQQLYSAGDELIVKGGASTGLEAGRHVVSRRNYTVNGKTKPPLVGEHTSGLLQITSVDEMSAVAVVIYACDEIIMGDFLGTFSPEPPAVGDLTGPPAFDAAATILFADYGQILGAPRRFMVIDQGSDRGIRPGQHMTLFRLDRRKAPVIIGKAYVVAVRNDSATIRVTDVTDAISAGDFAAPNGQH